MSEIITEVATIVAEGTFSLMNEHGMVVSILAVVGVIAVVGSIFTRAFDVFKYMSK